MTPEWVTALTMRLETDQDGDSSEDIWQATQKQLQIAEYRPHKNPHVIERKLEDRKGPYFVLKNTEEKTYLRLSSAEHDLWERMDGKSSVQELIVEHFMATGAFAHTLVVRLVDQLYKHSMLAESPMAVWSQVETALQRRSWLYRLSAPARFLLTRPFSFKGIDRFVGAVYRYGGWLSFTRLAQAIFLALSILGLVAFFEILRDARYAFIGDNVVIGLASIWLAAILPVLIHEMGHALTVKHYGREVPKGGVMLYFGMPAAFVETTDIWMEPRRARLAVTWNGPYTGLILGGAAAIFMWAVPSAPINPMLFKMAGFAYLTVFFNVNPLLKFDGYYLLSDAIDIPGLREKSMTFIRDRLLDKLLHRKKFTRDEVIYTVFGLLAAVWTIYGLYFAIFYWKSRLQSGLEVILGSGYSPVTRFFSLLLLAAVLSLGFLIALKLFQLGKMLVIRFGRSGELQRHYRLALIGGGLALVLGAGLPLAFPGYALALTTLGGGAAGLFAAYKVYVFNQPYRGSPRGLAHLAVAVTLCLAGLAQLSRLVFPGAAVVFWLQWAAMLVLAVGGLLLAWPPTKRLNIPVSGLGIAAISAVFVVFNWSGSLQLADPRLWIISILVLSGVWSLGSLLGSARLPAGVLLGGGSIAIGLAWFYPFSWIDLGFTGTLLLTAGTLHLVYSRLPKLSSYANLTRVSSHTRQAIGDGVAILVRRIITQVFFESGWRGVKQLGKEFSQTMRKQGLKMSIVGNQFQDEELSQRTADELTEVYGLAFDELHQLVHTELGDEMGHLVFGYGLDLLPWQTRELIAELILSRREWSLRLSKEVADSKQMRRNLLKRVQLFHDSSAEELDRLADSLSAERYAVGELILRQGDSGDKFYIIERGNASIWQSSPDGEEKQVDKLGPGQYFGELALISNAPRNATVRAVTPLALLSLHQEEFDQLVRQYVALD
ncbi:MAG TPA: cyclic nucleotide-binding domain-containing protein, partial [Anaerolineales bacterium]|nr:cyclic nucleotide-binding domain-containing protein [Anaerolineales bacterium]